MTENISAVNDPTSANAETSRREVAAFVADKPDRYFAYVALPSPGRPKVTRAVLTTWTGDVLGNIVELRAPIRDNFGGTRQYIRVTAVNGRMYSGWYYTSSGDYARIRALKGGRS
jgi:hypothetical protein